MVIGAEHASDFGLVWYEYPTWRRRPIAAGEFTTDAQTGDVDQDGDFDVIAGSLGQGICWYENPGGARAEAWTARLIGAAYGHDLEVGDVDQDGDLDVVTCDKQRVVLWRQEEGARWSEVKVVERAGEGIALSDLDGDRDLDLVYGGSWFEAPEKAGAAWRETSIDGSWHPETRARTGDMNGDGRPDVVLSVSEGAGPLAWFEAPLDPRDGGWIRHVIDGEALEGAHSLQLADLDLDGVLDVVTAEMHTSARRRVFAYLNEGAAWRRLLLSSEGSHNLRAGDLDGDGDPDLVGKNFAGEARALELWENQTRSAGWPCVLVDGERPQTQMGKMGLVFADADGDGRTDIVAGSYLYLNPIDAARERWQRVKLPGNVDVHFQIDVDGDRCCDLIGISANDIVWLEAADGDARAWRSLVVGSLPEGRTQGYATAELVAGVRPGLLFTRGQTLQFLQVPESAPEESKWPRFVASTETGEDGIAAGDVDRDGDVDVAAGSADGHRLLWLENRGGLGAPFPAHVVGHTRQWLDRIALADVNGDSRLDIVSAEESQDWEYNAAISWWEAPLDAAASPWTRHEVALLRSVNSMDVRDLDGDGDADIVAAEHTDQRDPEAAPDNLTAVFENRDQGSIWVVHPVDISHRSSHLGARLCDVDQDGDLDIVSMGWRQFACLRLWLNPERD